MPNTTTTNVLAALLMLLVVSADLCAHGGQYRQPKPNMGAPGVVATPATWRTWWDANKSEYLLASPDENRPLTAGSDDYYLGLRRPEPVRDIHAITKDDRLNRIVPALAALMAAEPGRDVQSACLVALGKVGLDAKGIDLDALLSSRIPSGNQEVRETAVLALGIAGRAKAVDRLLALIRDERDGRKLLGKKRVGMRVRTFATYALALIARRTGKPALQMQAYEALRDVLHDKKIKSRDLRVAAVLGIGILRADPERSTDKRLAWLAVEHLLEWFQKKRGNNEEAVQGHVPISIARLLGRGTTRLHQQCKEVFLKELTRGSHRGNPIVRGAAIALGMMSLPGEAHADDAKISKALRKSYGRGFDQHVRMFCVMAIAKIGGDSNRTWLIKSYPRGSKAMEKGWLTMGLGVIAADSAARGTVDHEIGNMLLDALVNESHVDQRTPLAIAVGMTRHKPVAPTLLRILEDRADNEDFAAYLCTSLGLLGDRKSVPLLVKILNKSKRRPFVMQRCAIALGQLGDGDVTKRLITMLSENDSIAVLASVAIAIARIGDRRAIDSLIERTKDKDMPALGRAFVAAALGGVGDKDPLPWNLPLTKDANFADAVDTLSNGMTGILDIL